MMEFAKELVSNVSCATSDLAKNVAGYSADFAKHAAGYSADLAKNAAGYSADLAKNVAGYSAGLAKRVGPRRGLIGLAIAGVAIGGAIVVARYLRARAAEAEQHGEEAPVAKNKRIAKAERRARAAYAALH